MHPLPKHEIPDDHLKMMTIRSHDQYNTTIHGSMTVTAAFCKSGESFSNVDDMAEHKLKAEDVVDIHNRFGGRHRVAQAFKVVLRHPPVVWRPISRSNARPH